MANQQTSQIPDQVVAYDMLKDSKFCITGIAKASTEAINPDFRQFLIDAMSECVQEHFVLADTLVSKGWYQPTNVQQQIQIDLNMAQSSTETKK